MTKVGLLSGLEIRDWLLRFTGEEKSNLDAISLSNCPKLSDEPRIKTVEYTVAGASVANVGLENGRHIDSENSLLFDLVSGMEFLPMTRNSRCYAETI